MPVPQGSTQTDAQAWAKIKPYATKAIKDAILAANTTGITVTLPPNVAFTNVEQTFIARQGFFTSSASTGGTYVSTVGIQTGVSGLAGASSAQFYGANIGVNVSEPTQNITGGITGLDAYAYLSGAITLASANAIKPTIILSAAGTLTASHVAYIDTQASAAGTYTNHHGLTVANISNTGGATVTKFAGIAVPDLTATNASNLVLGAADAPVGTFSIYNESARDNYFVGGLQLGGYSSSRTAKFYLEATSTVTAGTTYYGAWANISLQPASNSAGFFRAVSGFLDVPSGISANLTGSSASITGSTTFAGTGTMGNMQGGRFSAAVTGNGIATLAIGASVEVKNTSTGTLTTGIGFLVDAFANSGGGTYTGAAGIAMADMAGATNKTNLLLGTTTIPSGTYNIYAASTLANYFAGAVTIQNGFTVQQSASFFPIFNVAESVNNVGPQVLLRDARGSLGSETIVVDGSVIGAFLFQGYDGAAHQTAAFISATVNGTPGAGDMPGALRFWTTPDGAVVAVERLTIGQNGLVTINQATIGNEVARFQSTATNDDPRVSWYQNRAATTDATVTTIATVAIPATTTVMLEAHITARRTGGVAGTAEDGAAYVVRGCYKNVAGTATLIGAVNADYTAESQAGWDATFTVSGGNALIRVTGATNNNVSWHVTYKYYPVGS